MPVKHSIKTYIPDGYYYIYNRGIDGRSIFITKEDFLLLISYMKECLEVRDEVGLTNLIQDGSAYYKDRRMADRLMQRKNFSSDIKLFAYSLTRDQYHLLLQQREIDSMKGFVQSILTRYSMYFNRKYKRKGSLFESAYKAIQITSEEQLIETTKKIHTFASNYINKSNQNLEDYPYSSYQYYLTPDNTAKWLNTTLLLSLFSRRYPQIQYGEFIKS